MSYHTTISPPTGVSITVEEGTDGYVRARVGTIITAIEVIPDALLDDQRWIDIATQEALLHLLVETEAIAKRLRATLVLARRATS